MGKWSGPKLAGVIILSVIVGGSALAFIVTKFIPLTAIKEPGIPTAVDEERPIPTAFVCESSTTPTITQKTANSFTGASISGVKLDWRKKGTSSWTAVTGGSGSSFNADAFDKIEIILGSENTTHYGNILDVYTVPCSETPEQEEKVDVIATVGNLVATVWNKDNTVNANGTSDLDLSAGDVTTIPFQITGEYQKTWGNMNAGQSSNVLTCAYNKTIYDKIDITDTQGNSLSLTSTPDLFHVGSNGTTSWFFPVVRGSEDIDMKMVLDVDATVAPLGYEDGDVECGVYDSQLYHDATTTNEHFYGVEDENNNEVGASAPLSFNVHTK